MNDPPPLAEMLRAIATGRAVDWDTVEQTPADESLTSLVAELKVISRIAEVHNSTRQGRHEDDPDEEPLNSWGPLMLLECVGRGAYGDVYRAWDASLDREVALKLLRRAHEGPGAAPIIEEGRLLARVRHPNAITVHGADCFDGRAGIWMEFIEGSTLQEEVEARGPLPASEVVALGIDMCRALDAVHRAGIVHGDIKPHNVMREAGGRIVLMDFGSGVRLASNAGAVAGTPLYLAPELLEGGASSVRSDVYAVGVLLYHLLTRRYPLEGNTLAEVRARHRDSRPIPLRHVRADLPKALCVAIDRATSTDPLERYASAAVFEAALSKATKPRMTKSSALAAAVLFAMTGALVWMLLQQSTSRVPFEARDWVLVTAFDNRAGNAVPDGAVEHIFERELSNSPFVSVVPRDRVEDALLLMARPRDTRVDKIVGREVAIRDGAIRAIMVGSIERIGDRLAVTAQVVDPQSGVVLAGIGGEAADEAELLGAIRRGALSLRRALGEPVTRAQAEVALERVTTPSLRAAQLYTQADRAFLPGDPTVDGAAAPLLEQAIQLDPGFASAHMLLGRAYFNSNRERQADEHFRRAYDLSSTTSERERMFIAAGYHYYVLRQPAQAIELYEALLRVYPDHYWGIVELSLVNFRLGRLDDQNRLAVRLADLRPMNVRANWNAVTALSTPPGGFERARPYFERASRLIAGGVDGVPPELAELIKLYPASQLWRDGDIAAAYDALLRAESEGARPSGRTAYLHMTFGQLGEAERHLLRATLPDLRLHQALLALFRGDNQDALAYLAGAEGFATHMLGPAAAALIRLDRPLDATRVHRSLTRRLAASPTPFYAWTMDKQIVEGMLALRTGRLQEGISALEGVLPRRPFASPVVFLAWESLADAYAAMGRGEDARRAIGEATKAATSPSNPTAAFVMRLRMKLAELEREAGNSAEAEAIERTLHEQLAFADDDHPIASVLVRR